MRFATLLGLGRTERMIRSVDEALEATAVALPGFPVFDAVISDDGRVALVIATDGRIAIVRVRHNRAGGRIVDWPMLRQTDEGVLIETGNRRFGAMLLRGITALDIRRLGMPPLMQRELATIVPALENA